MSRLSLFRKRFIVKETIARGGFGVVSKARDMFTDMDVAIKHVSFNHVRETNRSINPLKAFQSERKFMQLVESDHVATLVDYTVTDTGGDLVTYLAKGDLADATEEVRMKKLIDEAQLKRWLFEALSGIAALHEEGVIHRDIKPENILIMDDGSAKICDLGLARALADCTNKDDEQKRSSMITMVGTPGYLAPELVNSGVVGPSNDVWAFGATICAILTGTTPQLQFLSISCMFNTMRIAWEQKRREALGITKVAQSCDLVPLSPELLELMNLALTQDETKRPTAAQLLQHKYFTGKYNPSLRVQEDVDIDEVFSDSDSDDDAIEEDDEQEILNDLPSGAVNAVLHNLGYNEALRRFAGNQSESFDDSHHDSESENGASAVMLKATDASVGTNSKAFRFD